MRIMKRIGFLSFATIVICLLIVIEGFAGVSYEKVVTDEGTDTEYVLLDVDFFPEPGDMYGWLWCERTRMLVRVFWGDMEQVLDYGAGTCMSGVMPGDRGPVILAGHVLSFFNPLQFLQEGDRLFLDTWYGRYEYEITDIEVLDQFDLQRLIDEKTGRVEETDVSRESRVFLLEEGGEDEPVVVFESEPQDDPKQDSWNSSNPRIIMMSPEDVVQAGLEVSQGKTQETALQEELIVYTCFPFYPTSEDKTNRYTLIARQVSGPSVIWLEEPSVFFSEIE